MMVCFVRGIGSRGIRAEDKKVKISSILITHQQVISETGKPRTYTYKLLIVT